MNPLVQALTASGSSLLAVLRNGTGPTLMLRADMDALPMAENTGLFVGGTNAGGYARAKAARAINDIPSNHSPKFAPVVHPTLETGLAAMPTAASVWLCRE